MGHPWFSWAGFFAAATDSASRFTPNRKSRPSLRQLRATAENCSRCHLIVTRDPTVKGRFTRKQAPDKDVSSRVAGLR